MKNNKIITPITLIGTDEYTDASDFSYPIAEDFYALSDDNKDPGNKGMDEEDEDDLDVPGSELDDDDELIGSEDEENNYYSIGGDNHNDLEEFDDQDEGV